MLHRYQQIAGAPQERVEDSYLIRRLREIVAAAYDGSFDEPHAEDVVRMLDFAEEKLALYSQPLPGTESFFHQATLCYDQLREALEQLYRGLGQEDSHLVDRGLALAEKSELGLQGLTLDVRRERAMDMAEIALA
ncbi:hypothetical protein DYH09_03040 [bacterium CPR1]|nr:hypothetical protein [bacterium CPR1]